MTSASRPTRKRTVSSTHHRDVEGFVIGRRVYRPPPAARQAASACAPADEIRPRPARLLAIHAGVGGLHEAGGIAGVVGVDRDPDAGGRRERLARQRVRLGERRLDASGDVPGDRAGLGGRQVGQEHDELVAGEARHDVVRACAPVQTSGHLAQKLVPSGVAHRVVHVLEAVDVDEEEARGSGAGGVDRRQRRAQALLEVRAVRKARQRVVEGEVLHGLLAALAIGDVGDEGVEDRTVARADRPQRHLGDELGSVPAPGAHLGARARPVRTPVWR
jgi:hypothetical protein